jgi:hypothetical protein
MLQTLLHPAHTILSMHPHVMLHALPWTVVIIFDSPCSILDSTSRVRTASFCLSCCGGRKKPPRPTAHLLTVLSTHLLPSPSSIHINAFTLHHPPRPLPRDRRTSGCLARGTQRIPLALPSRSVQREQNTTLTWSPFVCQAKLRVLGTTTPTSPWPILFDTLLFIVIHSAVARRPHPRVLSGEAQE